MTILSTSLAVLLYVISLALHESAHAYALKRLGYTIKSYGIGLPFAPRLKFAATEKRPYSISISPWVIAAYVQARDEDEEAIKDLRYWDQAWFSGAGVVANLAIGGILASVYLLLNGEPVKAAVWLAGGVAVWLLGRIICAVLIPIIAVGIVGLTFYGVFSSTVGWINGTQEAHYNGILGIAQLLTVDSPLDAISMAALMSIALGLTNMLPMAPFDGGRICGTLIHKWMGEKAAKRFVIITASLAVGLIVYVQLLDAAILLTK